MNAPQPISAADAVTLDDDTGAGNRKRLTRIALIGVGVVALVGMAIGGEHYWNVGRFQVSTDDAYVKADNTIVAPKIAGYVRELLVSDNQPVKAGQVLARIDDRDFRAALDQALASEQAASASVANIDAQIIAQGSAIRQADAAVGAAVASLGFAERNDVRRQKMAATGYGSVEQADSAATDSKEKAAGLERLRAAALAARQQIGVLQSQKALAIAEFAHARAARHQAELNLSYTNLTAPMDGTVGARTVRAGQYVQAGTQLMAVVPLGQVYVVANYKETQLTHVVAGQPATIHVDTFPGDDLHGRVDTLAPASGLEFSLLPSDNATGNFTKIVQRIPVKIVFPINGALAGRLRPGMSVNVSIDTRGAASAGAK
jgi:membrane fusion protein (multidrug efflux system)